MSMFTAMPVAAEVLPTTLRWSDGTRLDRMVKPIGHIAVSLMLVAAFAMLGHGDRVVGPKDYAALALAFILLVTGVMSARKAWLRTTPLSWWIEPKRVVVDWGCAGHWEIPASDMHLVQEKANVRLPHKKRPVGGQAAMCLYAGDGAFRLALPTAGLDPVALARALTARGFRVAGQAPAVGAPPFRSTTPTAVPRGSVVIPDSWRERRSTYAILPILIAVAAPIAALKSGNMACLWAVPGAVVVGPALAWLHDRDRAEVTFSSDGVRGTPRRGRKKTAQWEHRRETIGVVQVEGAGSRARLLIRGLDGGVLRQRGVRLKDPDDVRQACAAFGLPYGDERRRSDSSRL